METSLNGDDQPRSIYVRWTNGWTLCRGPRQRHRTTDRQTDRRTGDDILNGCNHVRCLSVRPSVRHSLHILSVNTLSISVFSVSGAGADPPAGHWTGVVFLLSKAAPVFYYRIAPSPPADNLSVKMRSPDFYRWIFNRERLFWGGDPIMGRLFLYFNKGEIYLFRDYFSRADFSWGRHIDVTPASTTKTIQTHVSQMNRTSCMRE